jgi:hypothetical protein
VASGRHDGHFLLQERIQQRAFAHVRPADNGHKTGTMPWRYILKQFYCWNDAIPFLPLLNAAQDLQAQVTYLDFDGGSGVRFITHYGQEPRPYVNDELLYTFQGLSADGRYYVSVTFPINAAILPASFSDSPVTDDFEAFARNLAAYQAETTEVAQSVDFVRFYA